MRQKWYFRKASGKLEAQTRADILVRLWGRGNIENPYGTRHWLARHGDFFVTVGDWSARRAKGTANQRRPSYENIK